jgi:hypothetical protein
MNKHTLAVTLLLALCGVWAGCAKKASSPAQVFEQATPEIKQAWNKAVAADKADDYVAAVTGYRELLLQKDKMSGEQAQALIDANLAVNQRLNAAFKQGDPAAKEAVGKLFQAQTPR